ncbi:MAG: cytochrome-c peroxidase [Gemmatimonadota bacterium]|nr:MAG: cytochrome-c peroxidase [Gemmatimonadota bacterium]
MKTVIGLAALGVIVAAGHKTAEVTGLIPGLPAPVVDSDYYEDGYAAREKIELGRALFFDKILSGNRNISCATCHHPELSTTDGLSLGLGEGPEGLGSGRTPGTTKATAVHGRIARNAPALFNLGAKEFTRLFLDGRIEADPKGYYEGGFVTPAKWKLPEGLDNVLAAQAMFPVISRLEMAGQKGENPIADAVSLNNAAGPGGAWELLAERLQAIPEYVELFEAAFPEQIEGADDITFVHAANAIAAFEAQAFRADDSPFDRYLRGSTEAMRPAARRGMELFYGKARCGECHGGKFQTDHEFHAIAMPQIGPGKSDGRHADYWRESGERAFLEDFGRGRVTVRPEDEFKFRTPSLRNVELTGPYGHDGAYDRLEDVVRHHLDPVGSLERYVADPDALPRLNGVLELTAVGARLSQSWLSDQRLAGFLMRDTWVQGHPELRARIAAANELAAIALSDTEVEDLLAFLESLTDPASRDLSEVVPRRVPSGLPVED